MPKPRVIHDFYGFPQALFDCDYPARGTPDVAEEVVEVVRPDVVALDYDGWSLDHGTWSVLAHLFPDADIPVLQLSIHAGEALAYHIQPGARLAPLRERGILILGSGNVVHNRCRVAWHIGDRAFDWAGDFDSMVRRIMTTRPQDIMRVTAHPVYALAVPTPEHFLPLAYLAGALFGNSAAS